MDNFFRYFYQDIGQVFRAFLEAISAILNFFNYLLNFPMRMNIIKEYEEDFSFGEWIALFIVNILLVALIVVLIILFAKLLRKIFRRYVPAKKYDEMVKQVRNLQRDLIRANYEKDKLLSMRIAQLGGGAEGLEDFFPGDEQTPQEDAEQTAEEFVPQELSRNTFESPCVDPQDSRFYRLTAVDNYYKVHYKAPQYEQDVTLKEFCERFRRFSASKLGLYYDIEMMEYFVASLGTARILILQGISGTGKTSLAYAFGQFVDNPSTVVSVQPAWRERTEMYGYFNEFSKKYSETDFLRAVYEANYYRDPHIVILDEMNIARVEYYFAEMLSILEMPRQEERVMDIVSATWENDPCLIKDGKVQISDNVWFVGTINNDDSTFAVADKVYDRAIPIDLDSRAEPFECEPEDPICISTDRLNQLFAEAKAKYPMSQESEDKLEILNAYLIKNFRLAFGNRIMKQIHDYVPCYVACGGTEKDAIDFIVAKKVLRKFESLNLSFMKDELTKFNAYLDKLFGKNTMKISKEYVELLKKNN